MFQSWFLAFSLCFCSCSYFIACSVIRYLSYEIKTTTSTEILYEVDFPAITFCHENRGKKSVVGSSDAYLKILAALIVRRREEFESKLQKITQTCKLVETNDSTLQAQMKKGYEFWRIFGLTKAFSLLVLDSFHTVVKCWWRNQEKNCSEMFLNHMTDHGWCFTINPHPDIVKSFSLGLKVTDNAYGLDLSYNFLKLGSSGPHNNLRLLLNMNQDEYCVSQHDTAGFQVIVTFCPV